MRYSVQPYACSNTPGERWAIIDANTGCVAVRKYGYRRFVQLTYQQRGKADKFCKTLNEEVANESH